MAAFFISGIFWFFSSGALSYIPLKPSDSHWNYNQSDQTYNQSTLQGLYRGYFGQSPIEIALENVSGDGKATGYSLHKGLKRPLNGTWETVPESSKVKFILNEPGDNKFDGQFELLMNAVTLEGEGLWRPKPNTGLGEVFVTLKKVN